MCTFVMTKAELSGGLIGEFALRCLSIQVLWLEEHLRGQGIGSSILKAAEDAAVKNGCEFATLDTMSFQAPMFYQKHGYVRVGAVEGYPGGAQKIFMRKSLTASV
jgi:GNAT superfamily N-acetyltransferase